MEQAPVSDGSSTSQDIDAFCRALRQGHVLDLAEIPMLTDGGTESHRLDHGAVIISQTCDVVLPKRPNVSVAAIRNLTGEELRQAQAQDNPRYVSLPAMDQSLFADLEYIATVEKRRLLGHRVSHGVQTNDDEQSRTFALSVGRRFSRFAFPDEVTPWLRPLQRSVREKYARPNSALGLAYQSVTEFRIEASNWHSRPLDLTLHFILKAGTLPPAPTDFSQPSGSTIAYLAIDGGRKPSEIAERILASPSPGPSDLSLLWHELAQSLTKACLEAGRRSADDTVRAAVRDMAAVVSTDDEFTLAQLRRSEILDLDYLSEPSPYAN